MKNLCLIILVAVLLVGCKTKERVVTVEKVRTDTTYITKHQRDSVWLHDSIHMTEKGDTIRIEKWHTKYVEKATHDTLYQATHDTIPQPYPVEKLVERELTWWQQTRMHLGEALLAIAGIAVVMFVIKRKIKGQKLL
jgi:cell division protein FtsL